MLTGAFTSTKLKIHQTFVNLPNLTTTIIFQLHNVLFKFNFYVRINHLFSNRKKQKQNKQHVTKQFEEYNGVRGDKIKGHDADSIK